jgi:hypothetical protein
MARISLSNGSLTYWTDNMTINADKYKQERLVFITAINDNYQRIKDLEGLTTVATLQEETWEATEGQDTFTLTDGRTFPNINNVLEVIVEGFEQVEGDEFIKVNNTSFKLSAPVSEGTRVYVKWYDTKSLNLFTLDLEAFTIMGVF